MQVERFDGGVWSHHELHSLPEREAGFETLAGLGSSARSPRREQLEQVGNVGTTVAVQVTPWSAPGRKQREQIDEVHDAGVVEISGAGLRSNRL